MAAWPALSTITLSAGDALLSLQGIVALKVIEYGAGLGVDHKLGRGSGLTA